MTAQAESLDIEQSIEQLLQSGRFDSRDAVLREGIRLIAADEAYWAEMDRELILRADGGANENYTPADEVFDRLERKYSAMIPHK